MTGNKRQYYRIQYKLEHAPRFESKGLLFPLCNLSEGGMAYRYPLSAAIGSGDRVRGTIVFPDNSKIVVSGVVTRLLATRVAIKFDAMIPLAIVMKEQRRLIRAGAIQA